MNIGRRIAIMPIFFLLIFLNNGNACTSTVGTNGSSWSISRQSGNISFDLSGSVEGKISPVDFHGRILGSYYSGYSDGGANDVRLKERTSALEGAYHSDNQVNLMFSPTQF